MKIISAIFFKPVTFGLLLLKDRKKAGNWLNATISTVATSSIMVVLAMFS
jgi:hypothetical protein